MNILISGGTGYIGSHVAAALASDSSSVMLYDNLHSSEIGVVDSLRKITQKNIAFIQGDMSDAEKIKQVLLDYKIDAVVHCAGLKAVQNSIYHPLRYYVNDVAGTINLVHTMQRVGIKTLLYTGSASVYGEPHYLPVDEVHAKNPVSPYGHTRSHIETLLNTLVNADPDWRIACLRCFNPAGSHPSNLLGDCLQTPAGITSNLLPKLAHAAHQKIPLQIFGNNYDTVDGTCVRDYVHILDLADAYAKSLQYIVQHKGLEVFNIGSGQGHSVLQILKCFEEVSGRAVLRQILPRRLGDVGSYYASVEKAQKLLGWNPQHGIHAICKSAWDFYFQDVGG